MAPAIPCKTIKKSKHGETRGETNDFKSKFACILEASESIRLRVEILYRIIMRTMLQERETFHCNITICEESRSKSSSGQGMGKIGEDSGVGPDESQK